MEFEWDPAKNAANVAKHHLDFEDAIGIFAGPVLTRASGRGDEARWVAVGVLDRRELAVVFAIRERRYRIISARRARTNERRDYRQAYPGH
jgi:uncharacterized DUF497 family protein